jgi:DNA polymerase-3 subunit delta'
MSAIENEGIMRMQLDGVKHPADSNKLIGHQNAQEVMAQALASEQLHHAWLITGAEGIGKATFAFHFAKHIIAHFRDKNLTGDSMFGEVGTTGFTELTQDDPISRQIANGSHPEVLYLSRPWDQKTKKFKTKLTVDVIRKTVKFFGATSMNDGWRIAIVDAADDMNASAANALLKILEEPPKRSLFLVVSHSPGKLLPTIRSRCRHLALKPLDFDEIKTILNLQEGVTLPSGEVLDAVAKLSEGSAKRAVQLCEGNALKHYQLFMEVTQNTTPNWIKIHSLADALAKAGNDDEYSLFFDMINGFLARRVRAQDEPLMHHQEGLLNPSHFPLAHWADLWENLQKSRAVADGYNLDRKQVILSFFQALFQS